MPILHWIGKEKVINHHLDVPFRVLDHQYGFENGKQSKTETKSGNKIIHGDNLEALKALLPEYQGRIKCIYIDPPYNTGNEDWVYNDNVNDPKIKNWLHKVVGKEGEDLSRHDKWLCMMYPRLKLLHKLLADDGAIFISIDDNEQANLKLVCDEIFGAKNIIANLIWDLGTGTQAGHFVRAHEYILSYFKNKDSVPNFKGGEGIIEHSALKKISVKNPASKFIFPRGTRWDAPDGFELTGTWGGSEKTTLLEGKMIAKNGITTEDVILSAGWAQKNQMTEWFSGKKTVDSKGQLVKSFYFNKNGVLRYEKDRSVINPPTVLKEIASTKNGSATLQNIFGSTPFDFPKPFELIEYLIRLVTDKNSIILDSFAGSGTTAHAVLKLNSQDDGNRKFILVEMNSYAETITAERIKRVTAGYPGSIAVNGMFDFYSLGESLLTEEGMLNINMEKEKIRSYIFYSETASFLKNTECEDNLFLIDVFAGTAYYLLYNSESITTLNYEFLNTIKIKADQYVIYAHNCILTKDFLARHKIIFKKIPRDIALF